MIEMNIPWAAVKGNHDIEADLSGEDLAGVDEAYPLSYTKRGPISIFGAPNFMLRIRSSHSLTNTSAAVSFYALVESAY
jgi:hypothetical protein